jgi:hypothetical protein
MSKFALALCIALVMFIAEAIVAEGDKGSQKYSKPQPDRLSPFWDERPRLV